jgi:hypothetical protein
MDKGKHYKPTYDRYIIGHCKQNGLGYLLYPHFMTLYLRYGWRILEKAPQYKRGNLSLEQLNEDIELLYGIGSSSPDAGVLNPPFVRRRNRGSLGIRGVGIRIWVRMVSRRRRYYCRLISRADSGIGRYRIYSLEMTRRKRTRHDCFPNTAITFQAQN